MNHRPLDLDAVQAFVRIVELGSFTRAADAMGTTQAAVSLKLKRLEDRLGLRLVERTPRYVELSSPGAACRTCRACRSCCTHASRTPSRTTRSARWRQPSGARCEALEAGGAAQLIGQTTPNSLSSASSGTSCGSGSKSIRKPLANPSPTVNGLGSRVASVRS